LPWAQVDVYAVYRDPWGKVEPRCILSTAVHRQTARNVDWDSWTPYQIINYLGGRYHEVEGAQGLPVEPINIRSEGITS